MDDTNESPETTSGEEAGSQSNPGGLLHELTGTTSRVVYQAASILEEEIAAGIVAAKQVEERLTRSGMLPKGRRDPVMQRFRRDFHEIVDLVLDLINAAMDYVGMPSEPAVTLRSSTEPRGTARRNPGKLPALMASGPTQAGQAVELALCLENGADEPTAEFTLLSTDLISASGERISARQVEFAPPTMAMEPGETREIVVTVNVPKGKPAGTYSGLLQATGVEQLRAVINIQVA